MPALYAQPAQPAWPDRCKHVHVSLAEVRNAAPRTDPVLREAAFQIYLRVARRELREALERMARASLDRTAARAIAAARLNAVARASVTPLTGTLQTRARSAVQSPLPRLELSPLKPPSPTAPPPTSPPAAVLAVSPTASSSGVAFASA